MPRKVEFIEPLTKQVGGRTIEYVGPLLQTPGLTQERPQEAMPSLPEIPGTERGELSRLQLLPSAYGSEITPNAPELMRLRERGMTGGVEPGIQPAINPVESAATAGIGTGVAALRQGGRLIPTLIRAGGSGTFAGGADVALGTIGEEVSKKYPTLGAIVPPVAGVMLGDPFARKIMQPSGKLRPGGERVQKWVKEHGAGPRPSSYIESPSLNLMERTAGLLPGGKLTQKIYAHKIETKIDEAVSDLRKSLPSPGSGKDVAGEAITESIATAKIEIGLDTRKAYKHFTDSITPAYLTTDKATEFRGIETKNLSNLLGKNIEELDPLLQEHILKYMDETGALSPQNAHDFQNELWNLTPKTERKKTWIVFEAFRKDLKEHDKRYGTNSEASFRAAQDAYQVQRAFESNPQLKTILRAANNDIERVIYSTFREGNTKTVNTIRKYMDIESWDIARSRFLENLIDAAAPQEGLMRKFIPAKFAESVQKYERQLRNVFPDEIENILDFAAVCRAATKDVALAREPILKSLSLPGVLTAGAKYAGASPTGGISVISNLMATGITNELMRSRGAFRQWFGRKQKLYKD